jgi:hypothetical protein
VTTFLKALFAKFGIVFHGLESGNVATKFNNALDLVKDAHDLAQTTKANATVAINVLAGEVAAAEAIIAKAKAIVG